MVARTSATCTSALDLTLDLSQFQCRMSQCPGAEPWKRGVRFRYRGNTLEICRSGEISGTGLCEVLFLVRESTEGPFA